MYQGVMVNQMGIVKAVVTDVEIPSENNIKKAGHEEL